MPHCPPACALPATLPACAAYPACVVSCLHLAMATTTAVNGSLSHVVFLHALFSALLLLGTRYLGTTCLATL